MNVGTLLKDKDICVCAGAGGVGKTTTSAAIGLGMAVEGRKVAVLTIDPARRLANAMGLKELGNTASRVDPEALEAAAGRPVKGELWAMMLDPKRTFDELIERWAPDEAARQRVLGNRIYRQLSTAIAGSQEYAAMEKIYELHQDGGYDLLVLDTPPTRNALDFLDAPERMSRFLDSKALQLFLRPSKFGIRAIGRGGSIFASLLKRVTGVDLLEDLSEFFNALGDMAQGFRERAQEVNRLLADHRTGFMLITAPQREPIDEAIYFAKRLEEANLQFGGVIVNKVHYDYVEHAVNSDAERSEDEILYRSAVLLDKALASDGNPDLAKKVLETFHDYQVLAERDRRNVARLLHHVDSRRVVKVPCFDEEVCDLGGLARMNRYLFASRSKRNAILAAVD